LALRNRNGAGRDKIPDRKNHGLRVIRSDELDAHTPQTSGIPHDNPLHSAPGKHRAAQF